MTAARKAITAGLASAAALAVFAVPAISQSSTSDVHVVHGIPGVTVDVYADEALLLEDFAPGTRTDAVALAPGNYNIDVVPADGDPATDAVIDQTVVVPDAGLDIDLVAHLSASGTPVLTGFLNDVSNTDAGTGNLVVRHTAAAPAVDVRVDGTPVIEGLENPSEVALKLPAGTLQDVDVVAAGGSTAVITIGDVTINNGEQTTVYAVGSLDDSTLAAQPYVEDVGEAAFARLEGKDRVQTAVAISQRAFPTGADVVYVANAFTLVDAMAGGVLTDGPILAIPQCGDLPTHVGEEIARLGADEVIALGGPVALCDEIVAEAATFATG